MAGSIFFNNFFSFFRPIVPGGKKVPPFGAGRQATTSRPEISIRGPEQHLGSVSSMFYEQLLLAKIPNAQKRQSSHQFLDFALLGSARTKVVGRTLMKLTPGDTRRAVRADAAKWGRCRSL